MCSLLHLGMTTEDLWEVKEAGIQKLHYNEKLRKELQMIFIMESFKARMALQSCYNWDKNHFSHGKVLNSGYLHGLLRVISGKALRCSTQQWTFMLVKKYALVLKMGKVSTLDNMKTKYMKQFQTGSDSKRCKTFPLSIPTFRNTDNGQEKCFCQMIHIIFSVV